ncbi:MAG: hypothetical protein DWQ07_13075 [Chloroflexi bacterium]|nr:MAG: hypothetical protein DWQ07_13075 [Chloroflexota bacterium]MBL1196973.1 hypothetical protein [Chloroflexota bacterium]NOH14269.1 molybdopterin-dependent oxidoreductase [Chloroflexota bacterium]
MTLRFVNGALLITLIVILLSGVYGIVWTLDGWMYEVHRIGSWALIALIPWKVGISWASLKRGFAFNITRGLVPIVSLLLSGLVIFVILLGLGWAWRIGPVVLWLYETVISWHWILALASIPFFLLHVWQRWPKIKQRDLLSRSGFLKLSALGAVGVVGWWLSQMWAVLRQDEDMPRSVSGSRLNGYFSGNQFPVTTGYGDGRQAVDLDSWQLSIGGAVAQPFALTYPDILSLTSSSQVATIDCTIGWYSVQRWGGLRMVDLLQLAGSQDDIQQVRIQAVSGYTKTYPMVEAKDILLATHVGGEVLNHSHGFPLRAVVPSRRGWFWVKWVEIVTAIVQ